MATLVSSLGTMWKFSCHCKSLPTPTIKSTTTTTTTTLSVGVVMGVASFYEVGHSLHYSCSFS